MSYIEVDINLEKADIFGEIIIAKLNEINFESYEEVDTGVRAYISKKKFHLKRTKQVIKEIQNLTSLQYSITEISQKNWNAEWESSFTPIYINKKCAIRADFHEPILNIPYEIIITPKMSFGTGHHSTTSLMLNQMLLFDFADKSVFDMGYGTGVLSILAAKLGSIQIRGLDISEFAFQNAKENAISNNIHCIDFQKGNIEKLKNHRYDIFLANINRNVLLKDMAIYSKTLKNNGLLLLSGFYEKDGVLIRQEAKKLDLQLISSKNKNKWQMLCFQK